MEKSKLSLILFSSFTITCTILNLSTALCNWIAYYEIYRKDRSRTFYFIWGRNFRDWQLLGERIFSVHNRICLLFVLIAGILFIIKKIPIDNYMWIILGFYGIQILAAIIFMYFCDPEKITCAVKNLFFIQFRSVRWFWSLFSLLIGVMLRKLKHPQSII